MRQILPAGEEPDKRPAQLGDMITNGAIQRGVTGLQRVDHRAYRDLTVDSERHFGAHLGQRSQMRWELDPDQSGIHESVCTSTERTAGRSRTMGAQLSPESADA